METVELPSNSIGISDIIAWMDCRRRMSFSMKRHTAEGEPPEAAVEHAYGSCIHDVFEAIEKGGLDDDAACQLAFDKWGWALAPEDLEQLKADIATYRKREVVGVRTLANEDEFRVPLMQRNCPRCDGEGSRPSHQAPEASARDLVPCEHCETTGKITIYFRFRLDRLYQMVENASVFLHIDYKSSKWRKTEKEIHEDRQMWAYNWGIHQFFPECEQLFQRYDQLRYGYVPTQKSDQQREQMGEWLRRQATAILNDEDFGGDGLLLPKFNEWCPWCVIKESCTVIDRLSDFAKSRIAALDPDAVSVAKVGLDATEIETYVERLESVGTAKKVLESYEETVKNLIRKLPTSERKRLGWRLSDRKTDAWDANAMREAHAILGDDFYRLVGITKRRLDSLFDDDPRADQVRNLARKEITGDQLRKARG